MKNENGFVFPLTLGIVLLAFFIITASVEIYVSEERYLNETEEYYYLNSMSAMSIKSIIAEIKNGEYSESGILNFSNGSVNFSIQKNDLDQYTIALKGKFNNGRSIQNEVIYSNQEKRIVKWLE